MKLKKWIFLLLLLAILGIGGFFIYKYAFKDKKDNKSESSNGGNSDNPPQSNPDGKLSQQELEKYLLEKRLDLQKYFVFNLGELKTWQQGPKTEDNARLVSEDLSKHLNKLTISQEKKLTKKGHGIIIGKVGKYFGERVNKDRITFLGKEIGSLNSD